MSRSLAYARLLRLPNVFTALADVSVAFVVARDAVAPVAWVGVMIASAALYCAGMVLNDWFDRRVDAIERPTRPIPSGAITPDQALRLAVLLVLVALLATIPVGMVSGPRSLVPAIHVIILLALILAYDGGWKNTAAGPVLMGGCRMMNMLLGMSVVPREILPWSLRWPAALALGAYVAGITMFARDEAGTSKWRRLSTAFAVIMVGILGTAVVSGLAARPYGSLAVYLAAALAVSLMARAQPAFRDRSPTKVQAFVKSALLGIVAFDAIVAIGMAGPSGGAILLWLIPAILVGRWVYST